MKRQALIHLFQNMSSNDLIRDGFFGHRNNKQRSFVYKSLCWVAIHVTRLFDSSSERSILRFN